MSEKRENKLQLEDVFPAIRRLGGATTRNFMTYCWAESPRSVSATDLRLNIWPELDEARITNTLRVSFLPPIRNFLAQQCEGLTLYSLQQYSRWLLYPTLSNYSLFVPGEYLGMINNLSSDWQFIARQVHAFSVYKNSLISILSKEQTKLFDIYLLAQGKSVDDQEALDFWGGKNLKKNIYSLNGNLLDGRIKARIESVGPNSCCLRKTA